jgi:hypothetical protein
MLRIRREQMEQLEEARAQQYVRDLARFFRSRIPQMVRHVDDRELETRVRTAIDQARAWGMSGEDGIMQYVGLYLAAGPAFGNGPAVCHFLSHPGATPEVKVRRLFQLVVAKLNPAVRRTQPFGRR